MNQGKTVVTNVIAIGLIINTVSFLNLHSLSDFPLHVIFLIAQDGRIVIIKKMTSFFRVFAESSVAKALIYIVFVLRASNVQ